MTLLYIAYGSIAFLGLLALYLIHVIDKRLADAWQRMCDVIQDLNRELHLERRKTSELQAQIHKTGVYRGNDGMLHSLKDKT